MRRTLGTAVFSGMLGVTLFGIFLTPVFFYVIDWLGGTRLFASRAMHWLGELPLATVDSAAVAVAATERNGSKPRRPQRSRPSLEPMLHE